MLRRLVIAAAVCAVADFLGAPANAAPYRPGMPDLLTSAHFAVHFDGDPTAADYTTQTQAGDFAAMLETAYHSRVGLGFNAPADDVVTTPGKLDVYVADLSTDKVASSLFPDQVGPGSGT